MNLNERHQPSDSELESEIDEKLESALVRRIRSKAKPDWDGIVVDDQSASLAELPVTNGPSWATTRETTVVKELIDSITQVIRPTKIILFGSAVKANAKGEATFGPNSDLDLLVVIPNDHNKREIAKRVYFVLRNFLIPKDIVVVHQSETDAPKGVVASAMDEGRVIYGDRT